MNVACKLQKAISKISTFHNCSFLQTLPHCIKERVKEEILTKASKSCAWQRSQSSLRVYRAFSVTESTGPFEICWVRADTNRKRDCPTDSYGGNIYIREYTWVAEGNMCFLNPQQSGCMDRPWGSRTDRWTSSW